MLLIASPAANGEELGVALNNVAHEFAVCAAYYSIVSVALDMSDDPELARAYHQQTQQALRLAIGTGERIGLMKETTASRFRIAIEQMRERIDANTSNLSILTEEHFTPCLDLMDRPNYRVDYWLAN